MSQDVWSESRNVQIRKEVIYIYKTQASSTLDKQRTVCTLNQVGKKEQEESMEEDSSKGGLGFFVVFHGIASADLSPQELPSAVINAVSGTVESDTTLSWT